MMVNNLAGVIFALCVVWLFIIKWMLMPRKEKLPLTFQAAFLFVLVLIWMSVLRWYASRPVRYAPAWWNHVLYFFIPLPIAVLGCRVVWCFYSVRDRKSWSTQFCFQACIFLTLAALLSVLVTLLLAPIQTVREAAIFAGHY